MFMYMIYVLIWAAAQTASSKSRESTVKAAGLIGIIPRVVDSSFRSVLLENLGIYTHEKVTKETYGNKGIYTQQ